VKARETTPAGQGQGVSGKAEKADKSAASLEKRDERKAATRAAVKARQTTPAGEAPAPAAEAPKK